MREFVGVIRSTQRPEARHRMIGLKKDGLVSGELIQAKNQTGKDVLSSYGEPPIQEQSPAVHVASSLNLFSPCYGLLCRPIPIPSAKQRCISTFDSARTE
ncbi:hypothetical protein PAHAL_9G379900 [Panicum hallii]|uniref:Uncharacterized protein n=1 Tax=Panicum hallii TaxID=206008 RepID=A0A2S3INJ5_9POAL|nr:hypothetical protein PAHAL_9G379900 [Panicum hallii]